MGATNQPATISFSLYQGATFSAPVTLKNPDGTPIDLTGSTAILMVRRDISDPVALFTLSTTNGGIVLGGTLGTVTLNISAINTAALNIQWEGEFWVHDLLMTLSDGVTVNKTYQGAIFAYPAITRPPAAAPAPSPAPPPTIVALSFSALVARNTSIACQLGGTDTTSGGPWAFQFTITAYPAHGALIFIGPSTNEAIYTPTTSYTGADSFRYTVTTLNGTSPEGVASLTVF